MAGSGEGPEWMRPADGEILADLAERRLDYVPLIAARCGINLRYAERRCRALADHGLIERATDEVTYRITGRGERYLEDGRDAAAGRDG